MPGAVILVKSPVSYPSDSGSNSTVGLLSIRPLGRVEVPEQGLASQETATSSRHSSGPIEAMRSMEPMPSILQQGGDKPAFAKPLYSEASKAGTIPTSHGWPSWMPEGAVRVYSYEEGDPEQVWNVE